MRPLAYALREAVASLKRGRTASVVAVLGIALATLVLGALLLVTSNAERLISEWSAAAEYSIYLRDDATSEQRGAIEQAIDESGTAASREYLSKADALNRFRRDFAELSAVASDLGGNPFPASLEVQVVPEAENDGRVERLVRRLATAAGVADIRYDREWMSRVTAGLSAVRRLGFVLVFVMMVAAALTVASVVRLALYARRDELEVMALVGAPYAFIRGPFVAEGLLAGGVGALIAVLALWAGFVAAAKWWGPALAATLAVADVQFLSIGLCAWLVLGGMAVGAMGGFAAARSAG